MIDLFLHIRKSEVYTEVAKTTGYIGAKMQQEGGSGNEGAYERISTTDENAEMLERFWVEACSSVTERFKPFLTSVSTNTEEGKEEAYGVQLEISSAFDASLAGSVETDLFSYFVASIVAKWNRLANKKEAAEYAGEADALMDGMLRKLYWRRKPAKPDLKALKSASAGGL